MNIQELFNNNTDITSLGYTKLFKFYLELKDKDIKKYIFKNLCNVKNIQEVDLFEVIKYCSIYNRSYLQIKHANDHTLFNSSYLNSIRIIIDIFKEKIDQFDSSVEYIVDNETSYEYFDLIIYYLKLFKEDKLYSKTYEILNLIVFNDLKVFYKLLYTYLTDNHFFNIKCLVVNEMFHLKDILYNYLSKSNDITNIKKIIEERFVHIPTTTGSENFHKLKQLLEIRSVCCDKSVTFLYDGYQLMNFYKENNFFDFSAVSLQFFKVIEIELKEKIVNHCSYELNKQNLYYGLSELLNLNNFQEDFLSKLELGKMRYILREVKTIMYDIRNENEVNYFNKEIEVFYQRLVSLFMNVKTINFYLDVLNYKTIEMYRNSAVHTGILSYERANQAIEITNVFLKNIKELNYSYKFSDIVNLKLYDTPNFLKELLEEEK